MGLLDDKTAVITGASTGIGLATAQRFVDEGVAQSRWAALPKLTKSPRWRCFWPVIYRASPPGPPSPPTAAPTKFDERSDSRDVFFGFGSWIIWRIVDISLGTRCVVQGAVGSLDRREGGKACG